MGFWGQLKWEKSVGGREGGRVRKVRGQRAAAVVALERRGGMEDKGLKWGGGRGERKMLVIPSVLIAELDGQAERT